MTTTLRSVLRSRLLVVCTAVLVLSGCLTIEENYTFKSNGSGTMEYVVDISEMMELMKGLEGLSDGKDKDAGMGDMDLGDQADALRKIPGIRKVKVKKEKEGSVQRLSFKFADLAALNNALNQIMPDSSGVRSNFFSWEGNTLVRLNNRHALEVGDDMGEEDPSDTSGATQILQSMKYKYSFSFPSPIGSIDLADGVNKEQPGPKEVKLDTDWSVIMRDPKALDLRITLDR